MFVPFILSAVSSVAKFHNRANDFHMSEVLSIFHIKENLITFHFLEVHVVMPRDRLLIKSQWSSFLDQSHIDLPVDIINSSLG